MHRLLQQQISRFVDDRAALPPWWNIFVAAVSDAYEGADAHRLLIERSLRETAESNMALHKELSERQRAEAQLEHLLSLLGAILESTTDGMLALGRDGRIVRFNQRFVDMWSIPDEIMAFWEHQKVVEHVLSQLKDPGSLREKIVYLQCHPEAESNDVLECLDGRIIERYSLPQILGVDSVGIILSFRDITARRQAEDALLKEKEEQQVLIMKLAQAHTQMLHSEKMASIGQLAAGVAHEINNPIGFVSSNLGSLQGYVQNLFSVLELYERAEPQLAQGMLDEIDVLKKKIDLDYLKQDTLDLINESYTGVQRIKRIVQDLKDFSHVDEMEWQHVSLGSSLDSTLNVVHNQIKQNADVVKEYGDTPLVECMASQLNQVFMNLLVNASHAVGENRGVITVRTGAADGNVWVEIADNGAGIPPEVMPRIFDPFFTTKPVGKGTGLGLSLSYGIIEKHHGRIEVESEVGKGAVFKITLPVKQP